ncbi:MAG: hypothetical protein COB17_03840 [Sulfurimonas sp.]|nr:MAG: hypothetical protein COB17_03840 [Sulfurimonas sp.]
MIFSFSTLLNNFSNISHAFTTKDSCNLAFHVNDLKIDVIKRHEALAKELNYNKNSLVHMKQIHSDIVYIVDSKDNFDYPPTCDALITDIKNKPLMVMVADCSPILFYDKVKEVIAVAHAGRQGAFKNIIKNVLDKFTNNFNSDIGNILVSIGPNIKSCCYEVGLEIKIEAEKLNLEYSNNNNNFFLNIDKILKTQLLEYGLLEKNIEISDECTKCKKDKYFSYRANSNTGRFAGIIYMKE